MPDFGTTQIIEITIWVVEIAIYWAQSGHNPTIKLLGTIYQNDVIVEKPTQ